MSDTKFKEIEFKYYADNISLTDFTEFCSKRNPNKFILASGFDYFFSHKTDPDSFCRHRVGPDSNQLTLKRKTADANNFVRTEHNLDLNPDMTEDQVRALCRDLGFNYDTTIFKNCFIYKYDLFTLVYYVVYDTDMKELGRFVEIEMREDYNWDTAQSAWTALIEMERCCKPLGISPQARIKRSLFEMFKKT